LKHLGVIFWRHLGAICSCCRQSCCCPRSCCHFFCRPSQLLLLCHNCCSFPVLFPAVVIYSSCCTSYIGVGPVLCCGSASMLSPFAAQLNCCNCDRCLCSRCYLQLLGVLQKLPFMADAATSAENSHRWQPHPRSILVFTGVLMLLVALPGHRAHRRPGQAFACKFLSGQPGLPSGAPLAQNPGSNQLMRQSMARLHEHLLSRLTEFGVGAAANYSCCNASAAACIAYLPAVAHTPFFFLLLAFLGHGAQERAGPGVPSDPSLGTEPKEEPEQVSLKASLGSKQKEPVWTSFAASSGTEPWEEPARERTERCSEPL
jgi:hypothetical protein